jgi:hypothetical protein
VALEVFERDVPAVADVAEQADVAPVEHLAERRDDALDAWVIGRDAVAHETVGRGKLLEEVDRDVELALGLEQDVRGVDARGARADDGQPELGHGVLPVVLCDEWVSTP